MKDNFLTNTEKKNVVHGCLDELVKVFCQYFHLTTVEYC